MSTAVSKTQFTPEDLLELPDDRRYELVGGKLEEKPVSALASLVGSIMGGKLGSFVLDNRLGVVLDSTASYQCFASDPSLVRRPDASFIRRGRFPAGPLPEGHIQIAPDLAVEVISPNDIAYKVDEKIEEYLDAGVRLIWIVNPIRRAVRVYKPGEPGSDLRLQDTLEGGDVIPGFSCPIRDIFAAVDAALAP